MEQKSITPGTRQDKPGYSHAVEASGGQRLLYCAGQASMDAEGRPVHAGNMRGQIGQALDNIDTVLTQAGFDLSNVVQLNYYTTDVDGLFAHWDVVQSRLARAGCRPGGTLLGVSRLAFPELLIEIEATAVQ